MCFLSLKTMVFAREACRDISAQLISPGAVAPVLLIPPTSVFLTGPPACLSIQQWGSRDAGPYFFSRACGGASLSNPLVVLATAVWQLAACVPFLVFPGPPPGGAVCKETCKQYTRETTPDAMKSCSDRRPAYKFKFHCCNR